jgi:methylenetetrahydrofolate dehydrogenase (NADP+)/methenyltetrahydrofolate cyclohydrolase
MTALKYIFSNTTISTDLFVDLAKDIPFFKSNLRNKKLIIVGRGITGGQPIGKVFSKIKLNFLSMNRQTHEPEQYYKDADIIISAVGSKVFKSDMLKPGVILLSAGLRREEGVLKGDYEENEIKDVAGFYTPTPGGIGPIDVVYLYKNLVEATKMQLQQQK